ncbi:hypothetical protein BDV98DRAFT_566675 [Pterulicium gracile]|uniref:Uncharacterized protein n=1 Tax=Pterulicium gracile TaxID=1884261 RepID=A0A5C3QK05_9AGAR|nr:hypothetical protein BDV98DRAFT_566675 [Pterula gracilis]
MGHLLLGQSPRPSAPHQLRSAWASALPKNGMDALMRNGALRVALSTSLLVIDGHSTTCIAHFTSIPQKCAITLPRARKMILTKSCVRSSERSRTYTGVIRDLECRSSKFSLCCISKPPNYMQLAKPCSTL